MTKLQAKKRVLTIISKMEEIQRAEHSGELKNCPPLPILENKIQELMDWYSEA